MQVTAHSITISLLLPKYRHGESQDCFVTFLIKVCVCRMHQLALSLPHMLIFTITKGKQSRILSCSPASRPSKHSSRVL